MIRYSRPDYPSVFAELWGSMRDVFTGVPRDERGIPEPGWPTKAPPNRGVTNDDDDPAAHPRATGAV